MVNVLGRKPLAGVRKRNVLRIMLTDAERAALDSAAAGQPTSTWARDTLLKLAAEAPAAKGKPAKSSQRKR